MVDATKTRKVRLTDRDAEILRDHVGCFRMTTYEAVRRVYWPGETIHAAKSWVRRMREAGYLGDAPLYGGLNYYYPTHAAATEFQLESGSEGFRSPVRLAQVYGMLAFCCLGEQIHMKLSPSQFREKFPELVIGKQIPEEYYLDKEGERGRLGYLLIDTRRPLRRIRDRVRTLISERLQRESWKHSIIRKGRFVITIVTIREARIKQIARYVEDLHKEIQFRYAFVPEIGELLPAEPRHAGA